MRNEKTAPAESWSGFVKLFYPVIVIVSTENFSHGVWRDFRKRNSITT